MAGLGVVPITLGRELRAYQVAMVKAELEAGII